MLRGFCLSLALWALALPAWAAEPAPLSQATQECLECHAVVTPGIVAGWRAGRMARTTPARALKQPRQRRRISVERLPARLAEVAVGCAECHTLRPKAHADTFDHEGSAVHVVVTPDDCATCHPKERKQFAHSLKAKARVNLLGNPLYLDMVRQVVGLPRVHGIGVRAAAPSAADLADSCLYCHGTEVKVVGTRKVDNDLGQFEIPKLAGWPNRGVGRLNPDRSLGSCSACHTRHCFSIAVARSPAACVQCHKGPDVPAYKVYAVSKHGNLYTAVGKHWDLEAVPWKVGEHFLAPTCATCHISGLQHPEGEEIAPRTHALSDRLWWRILGLIYSHPHPKDPDTSRIRNAQGLPLPTGLDGTPARRFLIDAAEQTRRQERMARVCRACHGSQWVAGQMARMRRVNASADAAVKAATRLVQEAWRRGLAAGPPGASPFDEYLERLWVEQWLFFANSVRYATAMMGADLGTFENGRWYTTKTLRHMEDWLAARAGAVKAGAEQKK